MIINQSINQYIHNAP